MHFTCFNNICFLLNNTLNIITCHRCFNCRLKQGYICSPSPYLQNLRLCVNYLSDNLKLPPPFFITSRSATNDVHVQYMSYERRGPTIKSVPVLCVYRRMELMLSSYTRFNTSPLKHRSFPYLWKLTISFLSP